MQRRISIVCIILLSACIDAIDPETSEYDRILVVEGLITNQRGPWTIKLSSTTGIGDVFTVPETDARVIIRIESGARIDLIETSPGIYENWPGPGVVGQVYVLEVQRSNGEFYQSSREEMRPLPPIEKMYAEHFVDVDVADGIRTERNGFRVYIDFTDLPQRGDYIRFKSVGGIEELFTQMPTDLNPPPPCCYICYQRYDTFDRGIFLFDDFHFNGNTIQRFPLFPVGGLRKGRMLIRVQAASLTPSAYTFWNQLKTQVESQGTIFDPPPLNIRGNISSIDGSEKVALGYFGVSAVHTETLMLKRTDFPQVIGNPVPIGNCLSIYPESTEVVPREFQ